MTMRAANFATALRDAWTAFPPVIGDDAESRIETAKASYVLGDIEAHELEAIVGTVLELAEGSGE